MPPRGQQQAAASKRAASTTPATAPKKAKAAEPAVQKVADDVPLPETAMHPTTMYLQNAVLNLVDPILQEIADDAPLPMSGLQPYSPKLFTTNLTASGAFERIPFESLTLCLVQGPGNTVSPDYQS
jgi:hypothetical protein